MDTLADSNGAQLVYQSPLFTELQSIVSNRTNSVELPMTPNNLRVIDYAQDGRSTSEFPYRKHDVIYKREGLQVFHGKATLLSIGGGKIKMSFVWGNANMFQQLFEVSLRELANGTKDDFVWWKNGTEQKPADATYWSDYITFGAGVTKKHPMLPMRTIAQRMQQKFGITGIVGEFDEFVIPLQHLNGEQEAKDAEAVLFNTYAPNAAYYINYNSRFVYCMSGNDVTDVFGLIDAPHGKKHALMVDGLTTVKVRIPSGFTWKMYSGSGYTPSLSDGYGIFVKDGDGVIRLAYALDASHVRTTGPSGGYVTAVLQQTEEVEVNIGTYNATELYVGLCQYANAYAGNPVTFPDGSEATSFVPNEGIWDYYNLWANLPDWKCSDLLKQLMLLTGKFANCKNDKQVEFVSVDDVYANRVRALDWTDRLMTERGLPTERTFAFGKYYRENIFKYADDDTVAGEYNAVIPCDSELLEPSGVAVQLNFSANDGTLIPLYESTEGTLELRDIGQRILMASAQYPNSAKGATFPEAMNWKNMVDTYYASFKSFIRRPVVVKCNMWVNTADIINLDLTVPVYLCEFGHYYAINSMTVTSQHVANVELLQLSSEFNPQIQPTPPTPPEPPTPTESRSFDDSFNDSFN